MAVKSIRFAFPFAHSATSFAEGNITRDSLPLISLPPRGEGGEQSETDEGDKSYIIDGIPSSTTLWSPFSTSGKAVTSFGSSNINCAQQYPLPRRRLSYFYIKQLAASWAPDAVLALLPWQAEGAFTSGTSFINVGLTIPPFVLQHRKRSLYLT